MGLNPPGAVAALLRRTTPANSFMKAGTSPPPFAAPAAAASPPCAPPLRKEGEAPSVVFFRAILSPLELLSGAGKIGGLLEDPADPGLTTLPGLALPLAPPARESGEAPLLSCCCCLQLTTRSEDDLPPDPLRLSGGEDRWGVRPFHSSEEEESGSAGLEDAEEDSAPEGWWRSSFLASDLSISGDDKSAPLSSTVTPEGASLTEEALLLLHAPPPRSPEKRERGNC